MDGEYVSLDRRGELEARREGVTGRPVLSLASAERALSRRKRSGAAPGGRPAFS